MFKHYKKLILLLIPACAGFCLALALGAAEQPSELCHLCQNKALVKEAILAFHGYPQDPNWPEYFDPNYVEHDASPVYMPLDPDFISVFHECSCRRHTVELMSIIAEGDMVVVRLELICDEGPWEPYYISPQIAIFRIDNGKIVEGWPSFTVVTREGI